MPSDITPGAGGRTIRILVAEDDRVTSHLLCTLIRKKGWEAVPAMDAMQAMMFAMRPPRPDAILLDLNMPGGTGVGALQKLKASARTSAIPVVVLSGTTDADLPAKVREMGAEEFLAKPPEAVALFAALDRVIGNGG